MVSRNVAEERTMHPLLGAAGSTGLGLGLAAGFLATVPALARGGSVGLVGIALCSMALAAPVCLGLRTLSASWLAGLALSLAVAYVPLTLGAEWLVRTTHHRPLGAVTYAVFAWALLLGVVLVVRRVMPTLRASRALFRGLLVALLVIDALLLVRSRSAGVLEGAAWLMLVLLASLVPSSALAAMPSPRVQRAAWLCVLVGAGVWTVSAPESLRQASEVLSFPFRALLGRA